MKYLLILLCFPFWLSGQVVITSPDDIGLIEEGKTWVLDPSVDDPIKLAELSFAVDQALEKRQNSDEVTPPVNNDFEDLKILLKKQNALSAVSGKYKKEELINYAKWQNYPESEWVGLNKTPLIQYLIKRETP